LETKVCSKCGIEKPITEFSKHKGKKDGYEYQCKQCIKETTQNRINNRIYPEIKSKICIRCEQEKDINEFTKNKISLDGYDYYCKECKHEKENNYYAKDPTYRNQKIIEYHLKNPVSVQLSHKKFCKNNPDKVKAWGKEVKRRRKEAMSKLPNTFTNEEWQECLKYFNHTCAYCGNKEKLQRDHFVSAMHGGPFTKENVVCACSICNLRKGDRDFFEWYPKQDFYSKKREEKILRYLGYL
jgi:5-methylcytosine-specific restriction endonuclease McrA